MPVDLIADELLRSGRLQAGVARSPAIANIGRALSIRNVCSGMKGEGLPRAPHLTRGTMGSSGQRRPAFPGPCSPEPGFAGGDDTRTPLATVNEMGIPALVDLVKSSSVGSSDFVEASRSLAKLALAGRAIEAREATTAIFAKIVEAWADQFEPALCDAYVHFMSEVLCSEGSPVAAHLSDLGLSSPAQVRTRYAEVRRLARRRRVEPEHIRTVVVLSRVTLGADVAVTSAVIGAALQAFLDARICLLAPKKNLALFAAEPRVQGCPVSYQRSGLLRDRLASWFPVRECIREQVNGLSESEFLIVDPDSRMTQLGLLPVADDRSYRFFDSRSVSPRAVASVGQLAGAWCASMWGLDLNGPSPFVGLESGEAAVVDMLRSDRAKRVATVSFGVGGREAKRLGGQFEDALLESLWVRGFRTVLDCGAGDAEFQLALRRAHSFRGSTCHRVEGDGSQVHPSDLVTWQGSIHGFGSMIGASDLYIGYDSAAGHLAAAQGVPVISLFAGAPSERFIKRWTPWGRGRVDVVSACNPWELRDVLNRICTALDGHGRDRRR